MMRHRYAKPWKVRLRSSTWEGLTAVRMNGSGGWNDDEQCHDCARSHHLDVSHHLWAIPVKLDMRPSPVLRYFSGGSLIRSDDCWSYLLSVAAAVGVTGGRRQCAAHPLRRENCGD